MPITLYASSGALLDHLPTLLDETTDEEMPLAILLTNEGGGLAAVVEVSEVDVPMISVRSERLARLNFDMIGLVILDLTPEELLSASGRRLTRYKAIDRQQWHAEITHFSEQAIQCCLIDYRTS